MEAIERNARAQTQIIEDLLDMGRIISGKVRLDVQRVDLPAVIDAAMESDAARGRRPGRAAAEGPGPAGRPRQRRPRRGSSRSCGTW